MRRFIAPTCYALILLLLVSLCGSAPAQFQHCLGCQTVNRTFGEEMETWDVVVIATLQAQHPQALRTKEVELLPATFEIAQTIKGEKLVSLKQVVQANYYSDAAAGHPFLIMASNEGKTLTWHMAVELSPALKTYITSLARLPTKDRERYLFFQSHLEHQEDLIARDAYDELQKLPYDRLRAMRDQMPHDSLVAWIQDKDTPSSRRRLYLRMLGVCGREQDIPMLVDEIVSKDPKKRGLEAVIACFLTLRGKTGMPLVEARFLSNPKVEYPDLYSAIMALRFHATEEKVIPRKDLMQGFELVLNRPDMADLVIPDLARLEDWDQVHRLATMFKTADVKTSWLRVPVINYLRACPLPVAVKLLEECEKLDPESARRAKATEPVVEKKPLRVARRL